MPSIPIFSVGQQSVSKNVTGGHRLNMYLQVNPDGDKVQVNAIGTPGLLPFVNISAEQARGVHWVETINRLYSVHGNTLWEITQAGVFVTRGTLRTGDNQSYVGMANNGKQLLITTGQYAYLFVFETNSFTEITTLIPDYGVANTGVAGTCTFLDSFFIINQVGTGQFWISDSYDGMVWDSLNFATAESSPDNLQAVWADKGHLALIGTSSTEIWINTGAQAFPYERVAGAVSQSGLAAVWSVVDINGSLTALIRNKNGALSVARLDGYTWVAISTSDIDFIINSYDEPSSAVAFGYTQNGRHFYQINFQNDGKSWLYNFSANEWSQLKSSSSTRHLADRGCAFGEKYIVSDYSTGNLYQLSATAYTDNGAYIEREVIGKHTFKNSLNTMSIRRLRVEFEGGVGLIAGQGRLPTVMLQISRDNGHTWGNEMWTDIGAQGDYQQRAEWRRLGMSRDWLFKLRITDPVKVVLIRAVIEATELNK